MMNDEKSIFLEKLASNKEFLQSVAKAESKDELQKTFCNFGLDLSQDEIDAIIYMMNTSVSDELNEDSLDHVSGGVVDAVTVLGWAWKGAKTVAKTAWNLGKKLADWEKRH